MPSSAAILHFNPRARVGRDASAEWVLEKLEEFQSTRPRGARPTRARNPRGEDYFNPRARVGRDAKSHSHGQSHGNFNPRARVGRDNMTEQLTMLVKVISIHAPAWGATPLPRQADRRRLISIHAPAWGATAGRSAGGQAQTKFQSTRPRGARLQARAKQASAVEISIHAPAWGATHRQGRC